MIATFRIRNFRSFVDMTLDFRFAEGKAPNGYKEWDTLPFLAAGKDTRLVPCMALFGANASGKTNVIRALDALQRAVTDKAVDTYEPNKLHDRQGPTTFELTFMIAEDEFVYALEYDGSEVLREELVKNGKTHYAVTRQKGRFPPAICHENYPAEKLQSILDVECSDGQGRQIFTFLSRVGRSYQGLDHDVRNVFLELDGGLLVFGDSSIGFPSAVDNLTGYCGGDQAQALAEIVDLVRKLDIDIKDIVLRRELVEKDSRLINVFYREVPGKNQYETVEIGTLHADKQGGSVTFDFMEEESEGTQRLAGLAGLFLFALKGGHTLVIDELGCSLHSLLLRELLRLFKDKRYNVKGKAQLVFTTHNTDILDDEILRVSEVAIVRKTVQSGSLIKRIADFKREGRDVRNVTNFRKQYLDGFYSGVPHPAV